MIVIICKNEKIQNKSKTTVVLLECERRFTGFCPRDTNTWAAVFFRISKMACKNIVNTFFSAVMYIISLYLVSQRRKFRTTIPVGLFIFNILIAS